MKASSPHESTRPPGSGGALSRPGSPAGPRHGQPCPAAPWRYIRSRRAMAGKSDNKLEKMGKGEFKFKRFMVRHDRCAMKVGTDGVLLGAWARGGRRILDVGTGSGLVALMMAQRFPQARVTGVEVDEEACRQAAENMAASPFAERMDARRGRIQAQDFPQPFDAIVCNPPFYMDDSPHSPDRRRAMARHNDSLSFRELFAAAAKAITPDGYLSVVIPAQAGREMAGEAALAGWRLSRELALRSKPGKEVSRLLLEFTRQGDGGEAESGEETVYDDSGARSPWYRRLTGDFYLSPDELAALKAATG